MKKRAILITGGAGFIGYHLTHRLASDMDNSITLADNLARGRKDDMLDALVALPNVRLLEGDLRDSHFRQSLGSAYDEVYHFAAMLGVKNVLERPVDVLRINALLTADILEWFVDKGGAKFLFASTSEVYSWTQQFYTLPIPTPEDVPLALTDLKNSRSVYAASKSFGELCVTQYCLTAQRPFVILRYHNIYGPRMGYDHVIPQLYERAVTGEEPLTVYAADHRRAFCHIEDAITATILAMRDAAATAQTFNVGNDECEISIGDLAKKILAKCGRSTEIAPRQAANDPIKRRCPDISKARSVLGFRPRIDLDRGLERTIEWYSRNPRTPPISAASP